MSSEFSTPVRVGGTIKAKVVRIASSGAIVETGGGHQGIIRNREMSWTRSIRQSGPVVSEGEEVDVVVLEIGQDGFLELSLKRALGDPWEKVRRHKYRQGSIVSGEVVNLQPYGAFVELEPGIVGLLHKSTIPGGDHKETQDLLWVGDGVEATITEDGSRGRRIGLSIADHLARRSGRLWQDDRARRRRVLGGSGVLSNEASEIKEKLSLLKQVFGQRVSRILIVDDDAEFATGFAKWLRQLGYKVDAVETGEEALDVESTYELLFIDVDLPGVSGPSVAKSILSRDSSIEIILVTGLPWLEETAQMPDDLEVGAVLTKPLDYGEVLDILISAENGPLTRISLQDSLMIRRDVEFFEQVSILPDDYQDLREALDRVLDDLREETGAKEALVFRVDPSTERVSLLAAKGLDASVLNQEIAQSLRFSPVRDVALGREKIVESSATTSNKFRNLLKLLSFRTCIALPIPASVNNARYALFVFDYMPKQPVSAHQKQVFSTVQLIAALLHEEQVRSLIRKSQGSILTGQLASSLLHEIRGKVNRIEQHARLMELDCNDTSEAVWAASFATWAERFSGRIKHILGANAELRNLIHEYLGLMGKEEWRIVDINEVLQRTVQQLRPHALVNHVEIEPKLSTGLPRTLAIPMRLEQVFLNVGLNAIQQMARAGLQGNRLKISSQCNSVEDEYPLKVRFVDEGPGIHWKLWDWIFEMGTSTRSSGSGLGLFGSRGLLRSMGGRISVECSYMFVGSTFLIELPTASAKEVANGRGEC